MFCGNCGTKNEDNAAFCAGCGAALNPQPESTPAPAPAPNKKKGLIGIIAAVAAVVVALILIFSLTGRGAGSAKAVGKEFIKAFEKGNAKALINLMHKEVVKEDIGDKDDQKDFIEDMEEGFEELEDFDVELTLEDVEKVDKDELKELKEYYEDEYDLKVKDVKIVIIEMTVEVMGYEQTEELELYVVKIGGRWYLDSDFM